MIHLVCVLDYISVIDFVSVIYHKMTSFPLLVKNRITRTIYLFF